MVRSIDGDSPLTVSVYSIPLVYIGRPNARISRNLKSVETEQIKERTAGQVTATPLNFPSASSKATSHWRGQDDIHTLHWSLLVVNVYRMVMQNFQGGQRHMRRQANLL